MLFNVARFILQVTFGFQMKNGHFIQNVDEKKNNAGEKNFRVKNWGSVPGFKSIVILHVPEMSQNKLINCIFRDFRLGGISPPPMWFIWLEVFGPSRFRSGLIMEHPLAQLFSLRLIVGWVYGLFGSIAFNVSSCGRFAFKIILW